MKNFKVQQNNHPSFATHKSRSYSGIAINHRQEAKERFPVWSQPIITKIMCKPTKEELEIIEADPVDRVVENLVFLGVSTTVVVAAATTFTVWSLPLITIASLFSVGVLRDFQLTIGHEASHNSFFTKSKKLQLGKKSKVINDFILEFATTISVSANGTEYREEHKKHHNKSIFMTRDDPDAKLLLELGFSEEMTVKQLWAHLLKTAFSPTYHYKYLLARIRSNTVTAKGWRRVAGVSWIATLLGLAFVIPVSSWFFGIFLVWGPLWQIAALLQFCSEHPWLTHDGSVNSKQEYADGCHARFSWTPIPSIKLRGWQKLKAWTKWIAQMAFIELPVRIAVIPAPLAGHDSHHLAGFYRYDLSDWPNTIYHREKMIQQGDKFNLASREHYGIGSAIGHVFKSMSNKDK